MILWFRQDSFGVEPIPFSVCDEFLPYLTCPGILIAHLPSVLPATSLCQLVLFWPWTFFFKLLVGNKNVVLSGRASGRKLRAKGGCRNREAVCLKGLAHKWERKRNGSKGMGYMGVMGAFGLEKKFKFRHYIMLLGVSQQWTSRFW